MQRTFIALKPDAVARGLVGEILSIFEKKGYKIIALKMLHPTLEIAKQHYIEHKDKPFFQRLLKYLTSGPIVVAVLEGINAVEGVRHIVGSTDPNEAQAGTIRAIYAQKKEQNVIHASDSVENAKREIEIYFSENEFCTNYKNMMEIVFESE